ncbi:Similar to Dihydroxyacetone kinase 1; acc. no. O13902 [Pyronema omphalodes CBS 100304]|uniref:Similar to Dihydroxyacetone kinase 1 acc. no. O13902 n=1 Tax=Pyronema omphalodes (strain CBS 100304) TaxID=1076935 RepID=U4L5H4_PYROM|nr:Similar to Dihydroxyacetone kinase 1; acc. no. O13902 [Pyronema omphalodes CBS 100304]
MPVSSKHFINDPTQLVSFALKSVKYANPSTSIDEPNKIVYRKDASPDNVALVSGGGAGHEPSFAGFVGDGILRAAVSGTIFASPSVKQIYNCISQRVGENSGVLLIVMNYTGDVLHFGLATEKARAQGLDIEMVVVGEDVGVGREKSGKVGRRGMAGTVFVHKICGALAATGASLKECAGIARLVSKNLVTLGSSLSHVHIPGTAEMDECVELDEDELELGMGIHNERGCRRMKIPKIDCLVSTMLKQLLAGDDKDRAYLGPVTMGQEFVLMVNNLGGVSPLELGGVTAHVVESLEEEYQIKPKRVYSGTYMTSLNGHGFSITLLRLADTGLGCGKDMLSLLDAAHETLGWSSCVCSSTWSRPPSAPAPLIECDPTPTSSLRMDIPVFITTLKNGLKKIIEAEPELTRFDCLVGDGDCGTGLKRGAEAVIGFMKAGAVTEDPVSTVSRIAGVVEESMDGTSGALTSIYLNALVQALRNGSEATKVTGVDASVWAKAGMAALSDLGRYTPAQPGDRTMMDALYPFLAEFEKTGDVVRAAKEARAGADKTKGMKPKLGRTVYIEQVGDIPDPGAVGIAVLVEGLAGI